MKIIFPDEDYTLWLIFAKVDIFESRREQLTTERSSDGVFYGNSPPLSAPGQTGLIHYRQIASRRNTQIIAD